MREHIKHFRALPSTYVVLNERLIFIFVIITLSRPQDVEARAGALPSQSRGQILESKWMLLDK